MSSIWEILASWLLPPRAPESPLPDRAAKQRREADVILRQLRAELKLMERWKDASRRDLR
jgi:hypothetical protein